MTLHSSAQSDSTSPTCDACAAHCGHPVAVATGCTTAVGDHASAAFASELARRARRVLPCVRSMGSGTSPRRTDWGQTLSPVSVEVMWLPLLGMREIDRDLMTRMTKALLGMSSLGLGQMTLSGRRPLAPGKTRPMWLDEVAPSRMNRSRASTPTCQRQAPRPCQATSDRGSTSRSRRPCALRTREQRTARRCRRRSVVARGETVSWSACRRVGSMPGHRQCQVQRPLR